MSDLITIGDLKLLSHGELVGLAVRHMNDVDSLQAKVKELEGEKGLYKNTLLSLKVIDSKSSDGREMIDITLAKFNKQGK